MGAADAREIRGVELVERQLARERLVARRERHRRSVEPRRDEVRDANGRRAALACERHVVGVRAVRVGEPRARALGELVEGADDRHVPVLAAPDGQRRAPAALVGQEHVGIAPAPGAATNHAVFA